MAKTTENEEKPAVAEAVGSAAASDSPPVRAMSIEEAMSQAVKDAYADAEKVWARQNLSEEDKAKMSAEIVSPEEIKRRMLEARAKVISG